MRPGMGIIALALAIAACGRPENAQKANVRFLASEDAAVKGGAVGNDGSDVQRLDLLAFRSSDAMIDSYASSHGSTLAAEVTAGCPLEWFMVANAPEGMFDGIVHKEEFMALRTTLSHSASGTLVMHGEGTGIFGAGGASVPVLLSRYASKVSIGRIAVTWLEDFAVTPGCTLETIALINARGDMPMSGIQSENGLWYNCSSVDSGLPVTVAPCLISSPGLPIGGAAPVSIGTELYAMPNPSTSQDDANVQPWSPRQTRIAIGLRIDGVLQWYRIDLPAMQGNTHYRIENVYITGPGASVPDLGTDRVNLDFSVALRPWGSETSNVDFGY